MRRKLLTVDQAAEHLSISAAALRNWRMKGHGPSYMKLGSAVRYDTEALDDWMDSQVVHPTPVISRGRGRR
ncbi:helix-turn-helix domain-containing protein [Rhodococcus erythropolis]|uniref:helix-turn-helix domain-containing protein n=1 Tax=Rhodococcus erythropolis TaxID=1833 RepID=UPI00382A408D